jgi:hypothetical protein
VEKHNPELNAIIAMDVEGARKRARAADRALGRKQMWGPLHGVPMTIKESYDVVGMPTTWGVPDLKGNLPPRNALAVDRLLGAGVVLFGKTNVPIYLADYQSYNAIYGTTNNPWDLSRSPGGSSGGSAAALAAGLTGIEAGSDIGSSIRNPAHYCGVYGHKPTWGVVPPRGQALPGRLSQTDISVIGPMARGADDLEIGLVPHQEAEPVAHERVIVGHDDADRHFAIPCVHGTSIESAVPRPGEVSTSSRPPIACRRSRMPTSPSPPDSSDVSVTDRKSNPTPSSSITARSVSASYWTKMLTLSAFACLRTLLIASCTTRKSATL